MKEDDNIGCDDGDIPALTTPDQYIALHTAFERLMLPVVNNQGTLKKTHSAILRMVQGAIYGFWVGRGGITLGNINDMIDKMGAMFPVADVSQDQQRRQGFLAKCADAAELAFDIALNDKPLPPNARQQQQEI